MLYTIRYDRVQFEKAADFIFENNKSLYWNPTSARELESDIIQHMHDQARRNVSEQWCSWVHTAGYYLIFRRDEESDGTILLDVDIVVDLNVASTKRDIVCGTFSVAEW